VAAVMSKWKECRLRDVVQTNVNSLSAAYPYTDILYLDTGSITSGKLDSYQNMLLNDAPSRAKRLVKDEDIVYSTVRPIQRHYGFIKNPPSNLVVSTGFAVIETNKKLADPLFIYNFLSLNDIVEILDSVAEGSTSAYPSLKPSDIENLDILLPPLPEQKAIAEVLSSLDDKIDLLHRQNKTLEAMAEALFRQWFVEPCKDGLPEGWEEIMLRDICSVVTKGTTPTTLGNPFAETGINFIKAESITDEGDFLQGKFAKISNETNNLLKRSMLEYNDVLCTIAGTIGRIAIVDESILPANTNQAVAILRVDKQKYFGEFIYLFLKSKLFRETMDGKVVHAVQPNLSLCEIGNSAVCIPNQKELHSFKELIVPIFSKKKTNGQQIHTIENLRNALLPKLMSGEVRVGV
jgi:type I restriction enzyme S subunit